MTAFKPSSVAYFRQWSSSVPARRWPALAVEAARWQRRVRWGQALERIDAHMETAWLLARKSRVSFHVDVSSALAAIARVEADLAAAFVRMGDAMKPATQSLQEFQRQWEAKGLLDPGRLVVIRKARRPDA